MSGKQLLWIFKWARDRAPYFHGALALVCRSQVTLFKTVSEHIGEPCTAVLAMLSGNGEFSD